MFCDWILTLKVSSLRLDLFGQPMMAHLEGLRSMCYHLNKILEFVYLWLDVLEVVSNYCKGVGIYSDGACGIKCVEVVSKVIFF